MMAVLLRLQAAIAASWVKGDRDQRDEELNAER